MAASGAIWAGREERARVSSRLKMRENEGKNRNPSMGEKWSVKCLEVCFFVVT